MNKNLYIGNLATEVTEEDVVAAWQMIRETAGRQASAQ